VVIPKPNNPNGAGFADFSLMPSTSSGKVKMSFETSFHISFPKELPSF
jgi:hypothetical protein